MDKQSIDLKYIFGRGIGSPLPFHRPCLYTTVYISSPSSAPRPHRQKTSIDQHGAKNPEWNHPIRIYFDSIHRTNFADMSLKFDIKTQTVLGDKLVGSVDVPFAALASERPTGTLCHVSYQVTTPDGKPNGVLSFSYILNEFTVISTDHHPASPVRDTDMLHRGIEKVYPPIQKPDTKPQLYPTVDDTFENINAKPFVYTPLIPYPKPPPAMPELKRSLYPIVLTEPLIAYPVPNSGVNRYHDQYPTSLPSYPQVEPVVGLASYALPGHYPPLQSGFL